MNKKKLEELSPEELNSEIRKTLQISAEQKKFLEKKTEEIKKVLDSDWSHFLGFYQLLPDLPFPKDVKEKIVKKMEKKLFPKEIRKKYAK